MRNGRPVVGFGEELDSERLRAALKQLIGQVRKFSETLTPREALILEAGLTASHFEESVARGEWKRADAHAENLVKLMKQLRSG